MATAKVIAREIAVARISAGRAWRAVTLYSVWLLVTWLGPELSPSEGWNVWVTAAAVAGYSVLTVGALVAVWQAASRMLRGGLRRVVTAHLAPFWIVAVGCGCLGGAVWSAVDGPVASTWLGLGVALTSLTASYALARSLEVRALRRDQQQLAHSPVEVVLSTWERDLRGRLDAARSIRIG